MLSGGDLALNKFLVGIFAMTKGRWITSLEGRGHVRESYVGTLCHLKTQLHVLWHCSHQEACSPPTPLEPGTGFVAALIIEVYRVVQHGPQGWLRSCMTSIEFSKSSLFRTLQLP